MGHRGFGFLGPISGKKGFFCSGSHRALGMLQKWGEGAVFIKATEIVPRVRNTTTTTYNNVDKYNPTPWVGSKLRKCEGGVGLSTRIKKKKKSLFSVKPGLPHPPLGSCVWP